MPYALLIVILLLPTSCKNNAKGDNILNGLCIDKIELQHIKGSIQEILQVV